MESPYITLTMEVGGTDRRTLEGLHHALQRALREYIGVVSYIELRIAYQDQDQIDQDAQVEPSPQPFREGWGWCRTDTITDDEGC